MVNINDFTKRQQEILNALGDGRPHSATELMQYVHKEAKLGALQAQISHIRAKLRPAGQDIVCLNRGSPLYGKTPIYQRVRLLSDDGYGE